MARHEMEKIHAGIPCVGVGKRGKPGPGYFFSAGFTLMTPPPLGFSFSVADHVEELEVSGMGFLVP